MPTALLDIDGTLVDTNYHHALAWARAFDAEGVDVPPLWEIHRAIGIGGDQFIDAVAGEGAEAEHGDALRDGHAEQYSRLIGEVHPLPGARALLEALDEAGWTIVLSSSADPQETEHYVELLDASGLIADVTDSSDAEKTKPEPDVVQRALQKAGTRPQDAVFVGDSRWDCEAARQAGVACHAVRTGGYGTDELSEAGAESVHEDIRSLQERLLG